MKLVTDSGLWSTGHLAEPAPLVSVLEVSGAVLSWTVDDASGAASITFTNPARADWLWRVVGESGHTALAAALDEPTLDEPQSVELAGIDVLPASVDPLRRLALGHWIRRWWPASHRDGIAALDAALLDAEIAVLTAAAQEFFTDDTFDSDVAGLLRPHAAALVAHAHDGDPRVAELVQAGTELAADLGVVVDVGGQPAATRRRDDYALAAGPGAGQQGGRVIASGVDSVNWAAVPPGIFDAAERTVEWHVEPGDGGAKSVVRVELSGAGSPNGIPVRLRCGPVGGAGVLAAVGSVTLSVVDAQQRPMTESAAWDHDWRATTVMIGADVDESPLTRQRVRDFARARLSEPASDAFLAEILAAESDY
jgi:hypothetical protein